MADRGHENRPSGQPRIEFGLGQVLVLEAERVKLEGRTARQIVHRDHRLAAARIAADRVDRDRVVGRHDAGIDQRPQQRDRTGRIAARIGNPAAGGDARGLAVLHLGKAVGPVGIDAMRSTGVEQLRRVRAEPIGHRHRLPRGLVGQAQHHEIDRRHHVAARRRVLALRRRQAFDRDLGQVFQAGADAEPGRAGLAVDEHAWPVRCHLSTPRARITKPRSKSAPAGIP